MIATRSPPPSSASRLERPGVDLDDRGDDREPEAGAVVGAGSLGADPLERLRESFDLARVEDRAAVLDDELGA